MNFENLNVNTILTLAAAIIVAYVAIKFVTNVVYKVISLAIGCVLLVWVLGQFGISIPVLGTVVDYIYDATKYVWGNLQDILTKVKG